MPHLVGRAGSIDPNRVDGEGGSVCSSIIVIEEDDIREMLVVV